MRCRAASTATRHGQVPGMTDLGVRWPAAVLKNIVRFPGMQRLSRRVTMGLGRPRFGGRMRNGVGQPCAAVPAVGADFG